MSRWWLRLGQAALLLLVVFVGASAALLGWVAYQNRGTFYPGVKAAGTDLSGLSRSLAEKVLAEQVQGYLMHPVKVILPDTSHPDPSSPNHYQDLTVAATAGELGLTFASHSALDAAWSIGHQYIPFSPAWIKQVVPTLFDGSAYPLTYQVNQTSLNTFIKTEVVPKIGAPVAAALVVQGSTVSIKPPLPGFEIDQPALAKLLTTSLGSATDTDPTYLRAPVQEIEAAITQESVRPLADRLDQIGNMKVTLTATGVKAEPKRTDLLGWLQPVQDDQGNLSLSVNRDAISKYLSGYSGLDQTKSLKVLTDKMTSLATSSDSVASTLSLDLVAKPQPEAKALNPQDYTPGKFPGKYIEINLAKQEMFTFDGSTLLKHYIVSSGFWTTPTPTGVFSIHDKAQRAWSAAFGLYMPKWMDFKDGEYGIHALPVWPNGYVEGTNHLGIPVSHGCVRLSLADATEVYAWADIGTPVYIH